MSAHTPGPWLQDGRLVYALNDRGVNWFSASVQDAHTPESELIAVAQLMKAAPDLLAALEKLGRQVESGYFDHVATDHPNSAVITARAAIAKATGVQP